MFLCKLLSFQRYYHQKLISAPGLHEIRPLHLHAVEPGNLVCSYWRSIRIVPIETCIQQRSAGVVMWWWRGEFFVGSPNGSFTTTTSRSQSSITSVYRKYN